MSLFLIANIDWIDWATCAKEKYYGQATSILGDFKRLIVKQDIL